MAKIDMKKEMRDLYTSPKGKFQVVNVPPLKYIMVDGEGYPNDNEWFVEAMGALYAVAYTLKFKLKKGPDALDYVVMPLQGLWWAEDMEVFSMDRKADWLWTLMILQPEEVTDELFEDACAEVLKKKGLEAVKNLRLEAYHEGSAAQVLYIGPYDEEGPTIASLHEFIHNEGHKLRGKHHEIYLGDPRRTAPERLRTVIRQPFE
jgi:hypothetical protein